MIHYSNKPGVIAQLQRVEEGLLVKEEQEGKDVYYGGSQQWLQTQNGQHGGCGTVTGANILAYLAMTQKNLRPLYAYPDLKWIHYKKHLEEVYEIIKPISLEGVYYRLPGWLQSKMVPSLGIPGIDFFSKRMCRFAAKRGKTLQPVWLDTKARPSYNTSLHLSMDNAVRYLKQGIDSGCPVAMLNGLNPSLRKVQYPRSEKTPLLAAGNFQRHWVAVTGLYNDETSGDIHMEVSSWGYKATLILQEFWGRGYTGFIYFKDISS